MNETNNTYTPVADGYHDCKIVYAKLAEKHYGKEIVGHKIIELRLVATDTDVDNPAAYKAEMPIVLVPGLEWDFFNEKLQHGEWRKATAADTKDALENAGKCFPAWREYCEQLEDGRYDLAIGWFADRALTDGVNVRAKLTNGGTYTGSDGQEHFKLNAKIYAPFEARPLVAADESAQIAKAVKASGFKLFGAAKPTAPKPPAPPKPKAKSVDEVREEAFANYQRTHADDTSGAKFYALAAEVIGKEINSWESWTVADWQKIAATFDMPF